MARPGPFPTLVLQLLQLLILAYCVAATFNNRQFCGRPRVPAFGGFYGSSRRFFTRGSVVNYFCRPGYRMHGTVWTVCTYDGRWGLHWRFPPPFCRPYSIVNCGGLVAPTNGQVRLSGRTVGSRAQYFCNPGFSLVGISQRRCQSNGRWSGQAPVCRRIGLVACGNLPNPRFGRVVQTGNTVGSTATYSCLPGYTLVGTSMRTCQTNRRWSGVAPVCIRCGPPDAAKPPTPCGRLRSIRNGRFDLSGTRVGSIATYSCNQAFVLVGVKTRIFDRGCGNLPNPRFGRVVQNGTTVGSTATYSCLPGYTLVGTSTRTCQTNRRWSGVAPVCIRCDRLPDISNGQVDLSGRTVGSTATYTCNQGFVLVGSSTRICQRNGQWSGRAPSCALGCGNLPNPRFGRVVQNGTTVGSTATYSCLPGYTLVGTSTRTCQTNRQWSGVAPVCIRCDRLPDISNGQVDLSGRTVGSTATYICNQGFVLVGSSTRICQRNGQWSGRAPSCVVGCGNLPNPRFGRVVQNGTTVGSTATYSCLPGYTLVGTSTRTCQTNRRWSGVAPVCIRCDRLPDIRNGQVDLSGRTVGSTATYTCNQGFVLVGSSTRICQRNGQWSGRAPSCVVGCGNLPNPRFGRVGLTGRTVGSTATYSCLSGYTLVGTSTRTCQTNRRWSGVAPVCIRCERLPDISNGQVDLSGRTVGSTATYTCNQGFVLVGSNTRICQRNGQWSGREPSCAVKCGNLPNPRFGRVDMPGSTVGSTATYSCLSGYTLVGTSTRTCQSSGQWSGVAPVCIRCERLSDISNGRVEVSGRTVGSTATYSCNQGFVLVGSSTRICQRNGQWSGREPSCAVKCGNLPNPRFGRVDMPGSTVGSTATYNCLPGYTLVGTSTRTCQSSGQWSGVAPVCIRCERLPDISNGQVDLSGRTVGSTATYTCNQGFVLVGSSTRICQSNGQWSGRAPSCVDRGCGNLPNPRFGRVDLTGTIVGSTATYSCLSGYTLVGTSTRTCQTNRRWSGVAPVCIRCERLPDISNGQVDLSGRTVGSTATYTCNQGFALVGSSTRICQRNGQWSGREPSCVANCPSLPNPRFGRVDLTGTTVGSTATYRCQIGFKLVGESTRTCQSNGKWSGVAPICTRVVCGNLDRPRFGRVVMTGITFGSTATYSCQIGYRLVGESTRTCQANRQWSGVAPVCKIVDCGPLDNPEDGRVVVRETTFGSTAFYSCLEGFSLVGPTSRVCQANGQWSAFAPTCRGCERLPDISNGQVDLSGRTVGSTATYTCNQGFVLVGSSARICQRNGQWSGRAPSCVVVCGNLPNPRFGRVDLTGTTVGSTATYSCLPGYTLVGTSTRTCQTNRRWSGVAPVCIRCDRLPDISNGRVDLSGRTVGSTATYTCNQGFVLVGSSTRICQRNGRWSGREPSCAVKCVNLPNPRFGRVVQTGNTVGSTATYNCLPGYTLVGTSRRTCQSSGQWSGVAPVCIRCERLPDISNGQVDLSGRTVGSTATYTCNQGFVLVGSSTRICQRNGQWSGSQPSCVDKGCGNLPNPRFGRVDLTGTTVGSTATYSCLPGYTLVGASTRTCQTNRRWSGVAPVCIRCDRLPGIRNGQVDLSGRTVGSTATYTCNQGFVLVGSSTRICQSNGQWSGREPSCVDKGCGNLPNPRFGRVDLTGTIVGSTATYSCLPGYTLVGTLTRTCQTNRRWSGVAPVCIRCDRLPDIRNGRVDLSGRTVGSTATYTCNKGFVLVGSSTRICQSNGQWSGSEPSCRLLICSSLPNPSFGRVDLTGRTIGSTATYSCQRGYTLVGVTMRTCQANRQWSGKAPVCKIVDCGPLDNPEDGRVIVRETTFGSTASYSCRKGFDLIGPTSRVCQANGQWSAFAPTCRVVDCGPLNNPGNGRVVLTGTTFGSTATYSCQKGFALVGSSTRTCQANRVWSGQAPVCQALTCSRLRSPRFGQVTVTGITVGSTATYSCFKGYVLVGENTRTCQINRKWSGKAPVCRVVDCGHTLKVPSNGHVQVPCTRLDCTASYSCKSGYGLVGHRSRTCQPDGTWSHQTPTCQHKH